MSVEVENALRVRGLWPLVESAAKAEGVTPAEVVSRDKHRSASRARKRLARSLRAMGKSYPEIKRLLGYRDHTSIMYLCKGPL